MGASPASGGLDQYVATAFGTDYGELSAWYFRLALARGLREGTGRMSRRNLRTRRLIGAVLASLLAISMTAATAGTAAAAPAPFRTRTIEPWLPGQPPTTPPAVDLTAPCVRYVGHGELEAVFGYHNPGVYSAFTPLAADHGEPGANVIIRDPWGAAPPAVDTTNPQVTMFLPGWHRYAFAVRFRLGDRVAWQVRLPSKDDPNLDPGWKVTVRPDLLSWCGRSVPARFAVVQAASAFLNPVDIVRDTAGNITSYDVRINIEGARTACSTGGVALPTTQVVGWTPNPNLGPIPASAAADDA